jgi:hypothetical protein
VSEHERIPPKGLLGFDGFVAFVGHGRTPFPKNLTGLQRAIDDYWAALKAVGPVIPSERAIAAAMDAYTGNRAGESGELFDMAAVLRAAYAVDFREPVRPTEGTET